MNTVRKIVLSLLLSAVLCAGIAVFAVTGTAGTDIFLLVCVAVFLTLFLTVFFCFNIQPGVSSPDKIRPLAKTRGLKSGEEKPIVQYHAPDLLEELEAAEDVPLINTIVEQKSKQGVLSKTSNLRIAFDDDDIPYLTESSGLELVDGDIEAVSPFVSMLQDDAVELEDMVSESGASIFSRPFSFFPGNPELLQGAAYDAGRNVLYEKNGIHYISSDLFDADMEKELNKDFAQLVESVVNQP